MMPAQRRAILIAASAGVSLLACSDDPVEPTRDGPTTAVAVLGPAVADTIDARPTQPLVIEVRDAAGNPLKNVIVRFETQARTDTVRASERALYICIVNAPTCGQESTIDYTDSTGRAKVMVRFGTLAGKGVLRVLVPEFGLVDSTTYTVNPGVAKRIRVPADTALEIGSTATLRGRVVDRAENTRSDVTTPSTGPGTAFTFDVATSIATGRDFGTQWLFYRSGAFVDSTSVGVLPAGRLATVGSKKQLRVMNTDGRSARSFGALVLNGVVARFDAARERITIFGEFPIPSLTNPLIAVFDTAGVVQRQIFTSIDLNSILAVRRLADGNLLVVAHRNSIQGYTLFRIAPDNTLTAIVNLPGLQSTLGAVDVAPDGSRVVYATPAGLGSPELRVLTVATGQYQVFDSNAAVPRFSPLGTRIAYLAGGTIPTIVNPDGTGKRIVSATVLSASGLAWAPDETYLLGNAQGNTGFRFIRISDGASVIARYRNAAGVDEGYVQPDWR